MRRSNPLIGAEIVAVAFVRIRSRSRARGRRACADPPVRAVFGGFLCTGEVPTHGPIHGRVDHMVAHSIHSNSVPQLAAVRALRALKPKCPAFAGYHSSRVLQCL